MLPLVPFAIGLLTGAAAIQLWRVDKTRLGLGKARKKIREATVSGLNKIESSSAAMRERLAANAEAEAEAVAEVTDKAVTETKVPPAAAPAVDKKPAAKRAPARKKAAAPTAAPEQGATS
jgi:hypothetical protein